MKPYTGNLKKRSNLTSDPSLKVKLWSSVFKQPITLLILVLEVSSVKATYIKSCPVNLLMRSNLTSDLCLTEGQAGVKRLLRAYNSLNIGPRGLKCKGNLYKIMSCESFDAVKFDL